MFEAAEILTLLITGLFAGVLGGMLGVGGSVIMIPVMVALFGQAREPGFNQHLYQAAAMIVNIAVVVPAALRHRRANAIQFDVLKRVAPFALVFILVGVWLSNLAIFDGPEGVIWLGRVLAIFMVYIIVVNVRRLFEPRLEVSGERTVTYPRGGVVGAAVGVQAGLMGVGGGALAVPLQQVLMHLPLRNCIANSTMLICITAGFGAIYKNVTLAGHGLDWRISVSIALMLAPTAMLGGYFGGKLTHRLPLGWVRVLFIGLMCAAAWKMAAI